MSIKSAEKALEKAHADTGKWRRKREAAEQELAQLKASAGFQPGDDADNVTEKAKERAFAINDAQAVIAYADEAIAHGQTAIKDAERELLKAHALVLDGQAEQAEAKAASHTAEVDQKLAELRQLDGCEYVRKPLIRKGAQPVTGDSTQPFATLASRTPDSVTARLNREVDRLRIGAAAVRYFLDTGYVPRFRALRTSGGVQLNHTGGAATPLSPSLLPDVLKEGSPVDLAPPPREPAKVKNTSFHIRTGV